MTITLTVDNWLLEELIDRDAFTEQKRKLMEEKKTLQEQVESSERGHATEWLERVPRQQKSPWFRVKTAAAARHQK